MYAFNTALWLEVFAYCLKMGKRAFPHDNDLACDVATDCFDRFVKNHGDSTQGLHDFEAWVGKSIGGLKKGYLSKEARTQREGGDGEFSFDRIRAVQHDQETLYDVARWRERIARLPSPEREAFEIIADGGSVADIMAELNKGARAALYIVESAREKLARMAA